MYSMQTLPNYSLRTPVPFLLCSIGESMILFSWQFIHFGSNISFKTRKVPMATCKWRGMSWKHQMDVSFLVIEFWSTARVLIRAPCSWLAAVLSYHSRFIAFVKIFCRKHGIVKKLGTPKRNHIVFPDAKKQRVPKMLIEQLNEEDIPEEEELLDNASPEPPQSPPSVASDENQCLCSSPIDLFASGSSFTHPHPGTCGWLGNE